VPDRSLGTRVTINDKTYIIEGGRSGGGGTLFHSFSVFGLKNGEVGHFDNKAEVTSIFSRVTGSSPSLINGLIKANRTTSLYLMNPNGIIFGLGAQIDIDGLFKATTAKALIFEKDKNNVQRFEAAGGNSPLEVGGIIPGLQFGNSIANLEVKAAVSLEVREGQTILLAAGPNEVVVDGTVSAPAGGEIKISGGKITINGSLLNAYSGKDNGGSITLEGPSVTLNGSGQVISTTSSSGSGANITVKTGTLDLAAGSKLGTQSISIGNAGDITVAPPTAALLSVNGPGLIQTKATGVGNAGAIRIGSSSTGGPTGTTVGQGVKLEASGAGAKVDLLSLGNTSFQGGSIEASGGSIRVNGSTTAEVRGGSLQANGGLISVTGNTSTSITGGILTADKTSTTSGQILVGGKLSGTATSAPSTSTTIGGGSLQANGGLITVTGRDSTSITGGSLTADTAGTTAGRILVGGTLSGNNATASAVSKTTTVGSGANLTATGGTIDLLSTSGTTTSRGALAAEGGSINIRGDSASVSDGSIQANGGLIIVTGTKDTSISGGNLTADKTGTTAGRILVGGTLSGNNATASAVSKTTTVESGASLAATGGTIDLLSTGATTSRGALAADAGSIGVQGRSLTVGRGSLQADGGSISIKGTDSALIAGASLQAKNTGSGPTLKPGSIAVEGGSVTLGAESGRTTLLAGSGAVGGGQTNATTLTLLDAGPTGNGGTISVTGGVDKAIQIFSGVAAPSTPQGATTIRGASTITANQGGTISVSGSSKATISGGTLSALNSPTKNGSITIQGGDIEVGSETGRTILLAGAATPDTSEAPNLTLLDGGSSTPPSISLRGGENKTIQIFSGTAAAPQGSTTLRGATAVTATAPASSTPPTTPAHRIVVGGVISNGTAIAASSTTTVGNGSSLTANDGGSIDVLSTGNTSSSGKFQATNGSIKLAGANTAISDGMVTADQGGLIEVSGTTNVTIRGASISSLSRSPKTGTFSVKGGNIEIGQTMGRTIIRAGDSRPRNEEEPEQSRNLTLLDGGSNPNINITSGNNQRVQIFSGRSVNSTTTLRGTYVKAPGESGAIVVGGKFPTTSNSNPVTLSEYSNLNNNPYIKGNVKLDSATNFVKGDSTQNKATLTGISIEEAINFTLTRSFLKNYLTNLNEKNNNIITFNATGELKDGQKKPGFINVDFSKDVSPDLDVSVRNNAAAQINFNALDFITFKRAYIEIKANKTNAAGLFTLAAANDGVSFDNSRLITNGSNGDILISAKEGVSLVNKSILSTKLTGDGKNAGNIDINSKSLNLSNGSSIVADTSSKGDAGQIKIHSVNSSALDVRSISLNDTSRISAVSDSKAEGAGGDISIGSETLNTLSISGPGRITAETSGKGEGGSLNFRASTISLVNELKASTETSSSKNGGKLFVDTNTLNLRDGSELTTKTSGTGVAGKIFLNSPDTATQSITPFSPRNLTISFAGTNSKGEISKINASTTNPIDGGGTGGDIYVGTDNKTLTITGRGSITAETSGSGKGGFLSLKGSSITLSNGAKATAATSGTGIGGQILVNTSSLHLSKGRDGASSLTTEATGGKGNAGQIKINTDLANPQPTFISFSDNDTGNGSDRSLISAKTSKSAEGQGGDIFIGTANQPLTITGLGSITAETSGSGQGGSLNLKGSSITLSNGAKASAETSGSKNGGQILVNTSSLHLSKGRDGASSLTTEATGGTGKAGQININADLANPQPTFISFSDNDTGNGSDRSLISAKTSNAASGQGGDIFIGTANQPLTITGLGSITAETSGSGQGGSLDLKGSSILLDQGIKGTTATSGAGEAGTILVDTNSLHLSGGSKLTTEASSTGRAGRINLGGNNSRPLTIDFSGASQITAKTSQKASGGGKGGDISIGSANQTLTISGPGFITAETEGSGQGGSLNLKGSSISFAQGVKATTEASGSGQGGTINVNADSLNLDNQAQINSNTSSSGNGGRIALNAPNLTLNNGAVVTARTTGSGRGGTVQLQGNTIVLDGGSRVSAESGNVSDAATPSGPAGSIFITANGPNSLHLFKGSAITASTNSSQAFRNAGDLGNILIITPNLELNGSSRISTQSFSTAPGGNISIKAGRLQLNGGSAISAAGSGQGQAGNINLNVDKSLTLTQGSQINASTRSSSSGRGGANIDIQVGKDLFLFDNSSITAQALEMANGGNLDLRIPNGFLRAAFPVDGAGNDILAIAYGGDGGMINIRALGVFGFNFNSFLNPISEASSRSVSGRDGILGIFVPQLNPDRGILPIEQPLDPSNTLDQSCSPRAEQSSFRTCGRGGVAPQPGDNNARPAPLDDLGTLPEEALLNTAPASRLPLR
jgi:filamentous hemagglutinin family protein